VTMDDDGDSHPIVQSLLESLDLLGSFEDAVKRAEVDGAEPMKTAINAFLESLERAELVANEHPDGELTIPPALFAHLDDWDTVEINETEAVLKAHDQLRHKQRHMADLAALVQAAMSNAPSSSS